MGHGTFLLEDGGIRDELKDKSCWAVLPAMLGFEFWILDTEDIEFGEIGPELASCGSFVLWRNDKGYWKDSRDSADLR